MLSEPGTWKLSVNGANMETGETIMANVLVGVHEAGVSLTIASAAPHSEPEVLRLDLPVPCRTVDQLGRALRQVSQRQRIS